MVETCLSWLRRGWGAVRHGLNWLWRKLKRRPGVTLSYILFYLTPVISFLMVEVLSKNNPFTKLAFWQWALNLVWYFFLLFLGWLITGRRKGGVLFTVLLSFGFGLANHYVLAFRGRALFPIDLLGLKTAANVAGSYDYTPDGFVWGGAAILAGVILCLCLLPGQKERCRAKWMKRTRLGLCCGWAIYILAFFFTDLLPASGIYAQQWKTQGNGFLLNFTVSARYMRPEEPEDYSREEAEALIESLKAQGLTSDSLGEAEQAVNFIVIMDESFGDLTWFDSLTLSGDPTPFYHALTENTIKGRMVSPVTGGGTAAVEFEALTGNSMAFLPSGTVAYQLYLTDNTPSLAQIANALGAETSAYHPYLSSGWNRPTAYHLLGFDSQYYLDQIIDGTVFDTQYSDDELIRGYVSDSADFERLYRLTDAANGEGKGTFIFNVTMQNHSGYASEWTNLDEGVTLTGDFVGQGYDGSTSQYLALAGETDRALEELISHYSQVEQPTVILFFGDHQPPLNNDLYRDIYGKELDERTEEEVLEQYVTPFFLWANYDIEEAQDVTIGSNFLGVLASQVAGYPQTGYMKFLSMLNEEFAAITPVCYVTRDGTVTTQEADLTPEQEELLRQYQYLQCYNLFAGEKEDGFFFLTA